MQLLCALLIYLSHQTVSRISFLNTESTKFGTYWNTVISRRKEENGLCSFFGNEPEWRGWRLGLWKVRIVGFSSVDGMVGWECCAWNGVKGLYDPVGEWGRDNGKQGYVVCRACFVHHAKYTLYLILVASSNETDRSEHIRMPSPGTCSSDLLACFLEQHMLYSRPNLPLSIFSGFSPHNICPSSNLCIWGARRLPASNLAQSKDSVLALLLRSDERDIMARRLENMFLAGVSVKMGRSKGRQAPTMPSDDSTMGQYTVGVSRSF